MNVRYTVWSIAAISLIVGMLDCARASDDDLSSPADVAGVNAASESDQGGEITRYDDLADSPTWTFRGGTIFLQRCTDRPRELVHAVGLLGSFNALDASNFHFAAAAVPDLDLIHHGNFVDVEFRYFAADELTANPGSMVIGPSGGLLPPAGTVLFAFHGFPPIVPYIAGGNFVSSYETSQLRSFEINARKKLAPFLTLLAGYRHIDLNERIIGQFFPVAPNTGSFSIEGFNRMDGFQLGGDAVVWRPKAGRFRLEASAKVGVFGDATSNYGTFVTDFPTTLTATATGAHAALMTEWSVTAVYQITPRIAARVGYQGLLLDGVALASEQIGVLNPAAHTGAVENSGTPIYQGLVANLEYAW